jgi:hypothetical protein
MLQRTGSTAVRFAVGLAAAGAALVLSAGPGQTWQVWDANSQQWIDLPSPAASEVQR